MFKVNVPKLKGKMAEKGYTLTSLAKAAGVDRNTLHKYLSDPERMPYRLIGKLAVLLCDSPAEAEAILFYHELT